MAELPQRADAVVVPGGPGQANGLLVGPVGLPRAPEALERLGGVGGVARGAARRGGVGARERGERGRRVVAHERCVGLGQRVHRGRGNARRGGGATGLLPSHRPERGAGGGALQLQGRGISPALQSTLASHSRPRPSKAKWRSTGSGEPELSTMLSGLPPASTASAWPLGRQYRMTWGPTCSSLSASARSQSRSSSSPPWPALNRIAPSAHIESARASSVFACPLAVTTISASPSPASGLGVSKPS